MNLSYMLITAREKREKEEEEVRENDPWVVYSSTYEIDHCYGNGKQEMII